MANNGPAKISPEEIQKFQLILKTPVGADRTAKMNALNGTEKAHFVEYTNFLKRQQQKQQLEKEAAILKAREEELLRRDNAILTQASNQYAKTLDSATRDGVSVGQNASKMKY